VAWRTTFLWGLGAEVRLQRGTIRRKDDGRSSQRLESARSFFSLETQKLGITGELLERYGICATCGEWVTGIVINDDVAGVTTEDDRRRVEQDSVNCAVSDREGDGKID